MKEINYKEFSWEVIPSEDGKEKPEDHPLKTTEKAENTEKPEVSDVPAAEPETVKTAPADMSW